MRWQTLSRMPPRLICSTLLATWASRKSPRAGSQVDVMVETMIPNKPSTEAPCCLSRPFWTPRASLSRRWTGPTQPFSHRRSYLAPCPRPLQLSSILCGGHSPFLQIHTPVSLPCRPPSDWTVPKPSRLLNRVVGRRPLGTRSPPSPRLGRGEDL